MGVKTALFLIVVTDGFKKFETHHSFVVMLVLHQQYENQEVVLEDEVE